MRLMKQEVLLQWNYLTKMNLDRLTEVEDLIRELKPQYKEAKASGDKETLRNCPST